VLFHFFRFETSDDVLDHYRLDLLCATMSCEYWANRFSEQAQGQEPDARTDLFSFGAVLYGMTAARGAFSDYVC
jgi:hypothetical protein